MPQDLFPDPGPDGEEPASSPPPPGDEEGMGQGLYVCVPAGPVTLEGFAQGHCDIPGQADGFGVLDGEDARDLAAAGHLGNVSEETLTAISRYLHLFII
jgi:hypothetical protein